MHYFMIVYSQAEDRNKNKELYNMIVRIKKYVAKVAFFKEHEDGSISKEVREITLDGKRFSLGTVGKKIPREAKLEEMGWRETAYEIGVNELEKFLSDNGKLVTAENAE